MKILKKKEYYVGSYLQGMKTLYNFADLISVVLAYEQTDRPIEINGKHKIA